jgi:hypothetical protein
MTDRTPDAREALADRITAYLAGGGLFNPELANHEAVRDLLIECRAALAAPAQQPTEEQWRASKYGKAAEELADDYLRLSSENAALREALSAQQSVALQYTEAIGKAAQRYVERFPHAHPLPGQWCWQELWDAMRAAAAPSAAQPAQQAVAPGWKLVPEEPTSDMLHAGECYVGEGIMADDHSEDIARSTWKAMLAAAPAHPSHQPAQGWKSWLHDLMGEFDFTLPTPAYKQLLDALSTRPQPDQQAAQVVAQWQPIETAPKDGRSFVACQAGTHDWSVIYWDDFWDRWQDMCDEHEPPNWEPTHWIELPAAPEAAAEGKA